MPHVLDLALGILGDVGSTGLANINFKRDACTRQSMLFEVNQRVSFWNILPTQCGVDLPFIAYARSAGRDCPPAGRQRTGTRELHLRNDLKSFATMRRNGNCSLASYVRSLAHSPMVPQVYSLDDPMPAVRQWHAVPARHGAATAARTRPRADVVLTNRLSPLTHRVERRLTPGPRWRILLA